ncbi:MAG TPA: flagellar biosynthetic protein FliO [Tepidisphaeraceae bacterium]|nr:flagellar biosynthetic protein FliO [Tepidisphaeraceae bacterium]
MRFRNMALVALTVVALFARAGAAQSSRPSSSTSGAAVVPRGNPAPASIEKTVIRRSSDATATTRPTIAAKPAIGAFDTMHVVLSLGIVLTLIFALRWLGQRLFGKGMTSRSSRAVQVLSRNVISPKQQLLVVQVGRRLVVVGDSGQQMNSLCEITDPDEMAALIGQIHEEKRETSGNPFGSIFGRAGTAFEKETEPHRSVDVAEESEESADGLTTEATGELTGASPVHDTRDELSGLMDKVRLMSRQFRRT